MARRCFPVAKITGSSPVHIVLSFCRMYGVMGLFLDAVERCVAMACMGFSDQPFVAKGSWGLSGDIKTNVVLHQDTNDTRERRHSKAH